MAINEKDNAWYIVKAYGKNAWKDTASLDVMRVCENGFIESAEGEMDVAFTNPFYFRTASGKDPAILQSNVNLAVTSSVGNLKNVHIDVMQDGHLIKTVTLKNGHGKFVMPVNAILKISASGHPVIYRGLYLDYPPHRKLLEELASGRWRDRYDSPARTFKPGEVPWDAFNFERTKKVLSDVKWTIELVPGPRDGFRKEFESLF
jgi:hypothetical protein